jgi:hypothetical protein
MWVLGMKQKARLCENSNVERSFVDILITDRQNVNKRIENVDLIGPLLTQQGLGAPHPPRRVRSLSGLPDFSWSKHTKTGKI